MTKMLKNSILLQSVSTLLSPIVVTQTDNATPVIFSTSWPPFQMPAEPHYIALKDLLATTLVNNLPRYDHISSFISH